MAGKAGHKSRAGRDQCDRILRLRKFGVFEVKIRKARVGRNPNNPGTDVPIPERAVVKFKPGKDMREDVLKLTPADLARAEAHAAANPPSADEKEEGGAPAGA